MKLNKLNELNITTKSMLKMFLAIRLIRKSSNEKSIGDKINKLCIIILTPLLIK